MALIVALFLLWCRYHERLPGVTPELHTSALVPIPCWVSWVFDSMNLHCYSKGSSKQNCVLLSTSRRVRINMGEWVVSDGGDMWSVKLDVRDVSVTLILLFRIGRLLVPRG